MKLFSAGTLLAVALLSALLCVPFSPLTKPAPDLFALEVRMRAMEAGRVQVYFDRGGGFSEGESSSTLLRPEGAFTTVRLPMPAGTYQQLRFDPIDRPAAVDVEAVRVIRRDGTLLRDLPLNALVPGQGIQTASIVPEAGGPPAVQGSERTAGGPPAKSGTPLRLHVVPAAGANDPQLLTRFDPALVLESNWRDWLPRDARRWALVAASVLAALGVGRWITLRRTRSADEEPAQAGLLRHAAGETKAARRILLIAAVAVALSAYPVLFFGRSHVSPNHGTPLLYESWPTLPGYSEPTLTETMGADTGAIMLQQVPQAVVQASAWRHGEVPVWNRYNSTGTPLLGQGQSMVGDPLHFLVLAANGASWAWDLKYLVAKWLWAAGLGLVLLRLLREQEPAAADAWAERSSHAAKIRFIAAAVVAGAVPFIGFFVNRINHPAFFSLCYSPWILYGWLRITEAAGPRAAVGAVGGLMLANFAVMTSGTAKEAYMLLLSLNACGVALLLGDAAGWRAKALKFALLGWAGAIFVLLTAPWWSTFLHDLRHAYTAYNAVKAYQLQPSLLLGLFDEVFHRPVMPGLMTFNPSLSFLLLLGLVYFAATLRSQARHRALKTLALLSLVPAGLVFGLVPPQWLARVPFLGNVVHVDNTFSCVLIVLWSLLAGAGFAAALRRLGTRAGRGDLVISGLLLFMIVAAWIGFAQAVHRPVYGTAISVNHDGGSLPVSAFIWGYLASLVVAAVVLGATARRVLAAGRLTIASIVLMATASLVLCWRHGLHHSAAGFDAYVVQPGPRASFQAPSHAIQFVQAARQQEPVRVHGMGATLFPGWNAAYRLETIQGPDALVNARYRELVNAMKPIERMWDWRLFIAPDDLAAAQPFLDALNVRYYLASSGTAMPRGLPRVMSADLDVHESPTAWPRAFFTDRVFSYEHLNALIDALRSAEGRPFAGFAREDAAEILRLGLAHENWRDRRFSAADNYRLSETSTHFTVRATGPGVVVLTEANWPGDVRVFVNGAKQPLLRVNHAFIGVPVTAAGDYQVEVRYVPKGWYRNLALAGLGLFLLLGTAALVAVRRRKDRMPARPAPREVSMTSERRSR